MLLGVGIALCYATTRPNTAFGATGVTTFGTAFWSLTVSLNVIATLLIAGRLLYHQHKIRILKQSSQYTGVAAILVESAALYSISGLIYIPLFARNLPLQFPFAALFCSASVSDIHPLYLPQSQAFDQQSIAPNLIVLRMALGKAVKSTSDYTMTLGGSSRTRHANIEFAKASHPYTSSSVTASVPSGMKSYKEFTTTNLVDDEVYAMVRIQYETLRRLDCDGVHCRHPWTNRTLQRRVGYDRMTKRNGRIRPIRWHIFMTGLSHNNRNISFLVHHTQLPVRYKDNKISAHFLNDSEFHVECNSFTA